MTLLALLGVLVVLALIFSVVIKLVPVYIQHYSVVSSLRNVAAERTPNSRVTKAGVRARLLRQFNVNDIDLSKDTISIEMEGKRAKLKVEYEVRKPFVGNIDLIVHFDNSVEL